MISFAIVAIVCFSYFVQSAFGFGAGLIAIPFLSLLIDAKDAVLIVMIFSSVCGLLVLKLWKDVDWGGIRRLLPGLVLGTAAGLALFSTIDRRYLGAVLALYVLAYVAIDQFRPKSVTRLGAMLPIRLQSFVSGFGGGVIQGVMGTGGPMLVTYLKSHTASVAQFRATVTGIFFIANLIRMAVMGSENLIPPRIATVSLITLPFFGLAVIAGNALPSRFDPKTFHGIINALLVLSAVSVLIKQCL